MSITPMLHAARVPRCGRRPSLRLGDLAVRIPLVHDQLGDLQPVPGGFGLRQRGHEGWFRADSL